MTVEQKVIRRKGKGSKDNKEYAKESNGPIRGMGEVS